MSLRPLSDSDWEGGHRAIRPRRSLLAFLSFSGFVLCVCGANWFIGHVGHASTGGVHVLPVGWGWQAPSGMVLVGFSLTLRDLLQNLRGVRWTVAAIILGALLSVAFSPQLALASGVTFLVSEMADFAVYTPLRNRRLLLAVVVSNVVGALIDSILFLGLAFGLNAIHVFALPQVLGKIEWSAPAIPLVLLIRPASPLQDS